MNLASMLPAILILLCLPTFAQKVVPARAGMAYYAEGTFLVDGASVRSQNRLPHLTDGQVAASPRGHAELLLGPYATLWTGTRAQVRFDDTRVEDTGITVLEGEAIIEVRRTVETNRIRVRAGALEAELSREGVYRFNAAAPSLRVFAGEALVGSARLLRGEERSAASTALFDRKELDEFYYWSAYRSFLLEGESGRRDQWSGGAWGERSHSGFGVKFPEAAGAARVKYLAASEAGLLYYLDGGATTAQQRSTRLPLTLGRGNFVRTDTGKAEIFLGVGVIARLAPATRLTMVDTRAVRPIAAIEEGSVLIEVSDSAEAAPRIRIGGSETELLKQGLYSFDAKTGLLRVFGGEATVTAAGAAVRVRDSQQFNLLKPAAVVRFDTKLHDALFRWSADRSFALYNSSAAFMTSWEDQVRPGSYKHKQFGQRYGNVRRGAGPRPARGSQPRP